MTSFIALNGTFNSLVSLMQVGLDMAPTKAQIDTWESGCKSYNATVAAWKKAQAVDLAAFNALLAKNNLPALTVTPTKLTVRSCTFGPPAPRAGEAAVKTTAVTSRAERRLRQCARSRMRAFANPRGGRCVPWF